MTTIRQEDLIQSVADACSTSPTTTRSTTSRASPRAYEREQSPAAKDAMAQILINSRMCAEGHRPICQDTGIVTVFLKIGMDVRWDGATMSVDDMVNEGVRRAYNDPDNKLRASMLADPAGKRKNTRTTRRRWSTSSWCRATSVEVIVAAKGGGSEAKIQVRDAQSLRLDRRLGAQDRADDGRRLVPAGHARHRHRRHRREGDAAGEGGADGADRHTGADRSAARSNRAEELRLELYDKVNALGIGAQGLGGLTTVLDVKIKDYPTHAANLPVAMIPNCAATRHVHFVLDGSRPGGARAAEPRRLAQARPTTPARASGSISTR